METKTKTRTTNYILEKNITKTVQDKMAWRLDNAVVICQQHHCLCAITTTSLHFILEMIHLHPGEELGAISKSPLSYRHNNL